MSAKRQVTAHPKQSRGLVHALDGIGVQDDKSPQVVRKVQTPFLAQRTNGGPAKPGSWHQRLGHTFVNGAGSDGVE